MAAHPPVEESLARVPSLDLLDARARLDTHSRARRRRAHVPSLQRTRGRSARLLRAEMVKPLKGVVVSNKMMKSVTVMVERLYKHPRWGKYVRGRKKYMVRRVTRSKRVRLSAVTLNPIVSVITPVPDQNSGPP